VLELWLCEYRVELDSEPLRKTEGVAAYV